MQKRLLMVFFALIFVGKSFAQLFDEVSFLHNLKSSYYLLNNQSVKNFVVQITSAKMDAFTKANWDKTNVPVLQLIWQAPADVYLSEIKTPFNMNNEQKKEYRELLDGLKIQVRGIFLDLQRFYLTGLISDALLSNYTLKHNDEAVQMTFRNVDQQGTVVKYLLGLNALCILIDIEYPVQAKHMVIYPEFKLKDTKWLCQGWTVQTMINGQVRSGFKLTIDYERYNQIYLPVNFFLEVQKAEQKDKIYFDEIRFMNYQLNQNIEVSK
ncbi:hypothetical protein [Caldithrix abyssi]